MRVRVLAFANFFYDRRPSSEMRFLTASPLVVNPQRKRHFRTRFHAEDSQECAKLGARGSTRL